MPGGVINSPKREGLLPDVWPSVLDIGEPQENQDDQPP